MRVSLVAAMGRDRVIGVGNRLPWHIPADLRNFRRLTLNRPVLMGRRTFESLGRPLPRRLNLVLSRDPGFQSPGCRVVRSLEEGLGVAAGAEELMVIGGAQVYHLALPKAERQYLSLVQESFAGDSFYPALNPEEWRPVHHEVHPAGPDSPHAWSFLVLERKEEHKSAEDGGPRGGP